ncbi:MAG: VCBS repeat-containing protein, partial [Candidatus Devosia euplotis]|nr:VCBS repeat-containing protein [Candidatus Devosia euplotis]
MADLDQDGMPEIIVESGNDINVSPAINIFAGNSNSNTLPTETITLSTRLMANMAAADIDGNGSLELVVVDDTRTLRVYTGYTGGAAPMTLMASSPDVLADITGASPGVGPGPVGIADFNEDGQPEIFSGNDIFAFLGTFSSGVFTGSLRRVATGGAGPKGDATQSSTSRNFAIGATIPVDILPDGYCDECAGLELVAGPAVWAVDDDAMTALGDPAASIILAADLNTLEGVADQYLDGPAAVADLDLDGDLDIAVSGRKTGTGGGHGIYVGNPLDGEGMFSAVSDATNDTGPPSIANVFVDQDDPA